MSSASVKLLTTKLEEMKATRLECNLHVVRLSEAIECMEKDIERISSYKKEFTG